MLALADILEALKGTRPEKATQTIPHTAIDSRQVQAGSLFIAIPGENVDGHDFVGAAFEKGAAFALIQHEIDGDFKTLNLRTEISDEELDAPLCLLVDDTIVALQEIARFWRNKLDLRVIGITGSVGKSTTKELAAQALTSRYRTLKNFGNLNNEIGLPLTILGLTEKHERAILEMGFYVPGEINFLCEIAKPQVGVITNIGTVHAERAGSQEAIAQGKAELVEALPPAPEGIAILNYDDLWVREMAKKTDAQVFFYGLTSDSDLWADEIEGLGLDGIRFRLHYKHETLHMHLPLIGRHSVHTALRATAIALVEGLTWQEIINGLRAGRAQLRLVAVRSKCGALILDDTYNASPASTLAALNLLNELEGRKIAVLGDMLELGKYETQGHEMVGLRAAEVADILLTLGKRAHTIARAARQAGMSTEKILEFEDTASIIEWSKKNLTEKDSLLLKGSRGLHMDQIVTALEAK
ncbi:MAG: UDP-N-acetylmuramoyl-tripeptide--D-alanyl-D-alanine ligase [Anaerolineae bacterium]|nr:UDP-N-acetylmuramoyl-tripeptide--D-alanyl-D-alanine ligase [Anaerolineae bacterium]MBT7069914.1 UDP-N-acetylmuramoyl-tripeptide--D-alanyl-D-alanine ligase [Anaerolineae bacterium]MBT7323855.1 UDP-N-acetylmuramoyl-tripeptide--D-alanyl-D-alanine ligase [Anaerolineae bacterium]